MYRTATSNRMMGLALSTAMAGALLSGCTTAGSPLAALSRPSTETAQAADRSTQAIAQAEAGVLAEPRSAVQRAALGSAYLDAGRFASAATTFDDAMKLGDGSARTALSLALALIGAGEAPAAAALLNDRGADIATADLGLALALAGQPERGIHLMSNAIRNGDNTPKMRQNLAYAFALGGRWREARLMAAEDVPADRLGDRIEEWSVMASPEAWHHRVAALLQVPAGVRDAGQPVQLALANNPGIEQLLAEASALDVSEELPALAAAPVEERPAIAAIDPSTALDAGPAAIAPEPEAPAGLELALAAPTAIINAMANAAQEVAQIVRQPVAQPAIAPAPARQESAPRAVAAPAAAVARSEARPAPAPARAAQRAESSHLIQLGSFTSEQHARRAWDIYTKKYPELRGHEMVISEAVVRGKNYWRVAAAGFGKASSGSMCGRVKATGEGCIAYAANRPLPGAIDRGVRLATR